MDKTPPQQTEPKATCLDCGLELPPLLRSWCNQCLWAWHMPVSSGGSRHGVRRAPGDALATVSDELQAIDP